MNSFKQWEHKIKNVYIIKWQNEIQIRQKFPRDFVLIKCFSTTKWLKLVVVGFSFHNWLIGPVEEE